MSAPKSQRRRPSLVTCLLLSFGIFILVALNYVFTKLLCNTNETITKYLGIARYTGIIKF